MTSAIKIARENGGHNVLVDSGLATPMAVSIERKALLPPSLPSPPSTLGASSSPSSSVQVNVNPPPAAPPSASTSGPSQRNAGPAPPAISFNRSGAAGPSSSPSSSYPSSRSLFEANLGPPANADELGIDLLANDRKKIDYDSEGGSEYTHSEGMGGGEDDDGDDADGAFNRMFADQPPGGSASASGSGPTPAPEMTYEQIQEEKAWILSQLKRLERKGIVSPRRFGMESSLSDMKMELKRLKKEISIERSIGLCRNGLLFFVKVIEFVNGKWDPFDLRMQGWSQQMMTELDSYDEVFEELYEKYGSAIDVGPEIKLISMVSLSALSFYLQKTFVEKLQTTMGSGSNANNGGGGNAMGGLENIINKLSSLGRGGGNANANGPPPTRAPGTPLRREMRGPSVSTDELMASLNQGSGGAARYMAGLAEDDSDSDGSASVRVPIPPKGKKRGRPPMKKM